MELIERAEYLNVLNDRYEQMKTGHGHTLFVVGEAGAGKTSLVNRFIKDIERSVTTYIGACDSLFTPRPLGPLYDIAPQLNNDLLSLLRDEKDRALIFTAFFQAIASSSLPVVLFFEDIHWADESTIDFIKFFARRIARVKCLLVLTSRDNEITFTHHLRTLFSELPPTTFTKVSLNLLSREAVNELSKSKGSFSGERIYELTSGNPFYVFEILNSPQHRIPERVKDSILTVYHSKSAEVKALWEFLSILPGVRIEQSLVPILERDFSNGLDACVEQGIILWRPDHFSFKHQLYQLTVEESLSTSKRKMLHGKMLEFLSKTTDTPLAQLVHHAKFADERNTVIKLAPQAARHAASLGAHIEAVKLYAIAIEYSDKDDSSVIELYARHAYECYLTNQLVSAAESQRRVLEFWQKRNSNLQIGDALRFLSRLEWYQGNGQQAMTFGLKAVQTLEDCPPSREKALAYSNLSQLFMLSSKKDETLLWGDKAIQVSKELNDSEILSHALNNIGAVLLMYNVESGRDKLTESLSLALKHNYQEHAARAYTNLTEPYFSIPMKDHLTMSDEGIRYCEEHDLDSWKFYMMARRTRLLLQSGDWADSETLAWSLFNNPYHPTIVKIVVATSLAQLSTRRGFFEQARSRIVQGKKLAGRTGEAHRLIPLLVAELELSWLTGESIPTAELERAENEVVSSKDNFWYYSELSYWKYKCGLPVRDDIQYAGPFEHQIKGDLEKAIGQWRLLGCPYEYALALLEGNEEQQKEGLNILKALGADGVYEKAKMELKAKGVRVIPTGPRESTRNNPAQLTTRQVEVLMLLQQGLQNSEIAEKLFLSAKTIDHHISAILSKLEVNSRGKAVLKAKELGLLKY